MGRRIAILWHASFAVAAGVLYFFFVVPRWPELMGDTSHGLGTTLRIVTGALIALAALPVVFTLLRTRKPELGTPQLALSMRVRSIVAHVLAGLLIIGTAISEIWLSLDSAGQYLFAIYTAAAAIGLLGFFAFYLSFAAELPPPPPKPIKAKKPKRRRLRRKKGDVADAEEATDADEAETDEAEDTGADDAEETVTAEEAGKETETAEEPAEESVEPTAKAVEAVKAEKPSTDVPSDEADDDSEEPRSGLQNRRPEGKGTHRMRRRRTRGGVALNE